jgi:hypothetical protein
MRKRARLATTAGVTVLGFTALSGMGGTAHADSGGGLGLPIDLSGTLGKAGPLGKTVDGVLKNTLSSPASHAKAPVRPRASTPASPRARRSSPALSADVRAGVNVSLNPISVHAVARVRLCAGPVLVCARPPAPPNPIPPPPAPPNPPPTQNRPPGQPVQPVTPAVVADHGPASGTLNVIGNALPFTGGPTGALAFLGVLAVVTGAAGVAGSRVRFRR